MACFANIQAAMRMEFHVFRLFCGRASQTRIIHRLHETFGARTTVAHVTNSFNYFVCLVLHESHESSAHQTVRMCWKEAIRWRVCARNAFLSHWLCVHRKNQPPVTGTADNVCCFFMFFLGEGGGGEKVCRQHIAYHNEFSKLKFSCFCSTTLEYPTMTNSENTPKRFARRRRVVV